MSQVENAGSIGVDPVPLRSGTHCSRACVRSPLGVLNAGRESETEGSRSVIVLAPGAQCPHVA
jgi:hypothetical protein